MKPEASPGRAVARVESVPLLDLQRQYAQVRDEVLAAIARVADSQQLILGPEVEAFEKSAAAFLGTRACVGCASGSDAIWLALAACGVGPGDEVITTPFSFFATVSAILRAGARPVLADVDPRTLNLDPRQVEARITGAPSSRLRALLPVHLYGQCADMDALQRIADVHKLLVIEDAAQAFGAAWRGRRAGSLGLTAAFSFYPTKNLSALGDAGCVTTSDDAVAARLRRLRNHGSARRYHHDEVGWNSRLDSVQAAVLNVKLKHIERWNRERRERAAAYDRLLAASGLTSHGGPLAQLETAREASHIYHQYVVRAERRDELRRFLTERGVGTEVYYPAPLHRQPCFRYLGYEEGSLPEAERAAREVLALPMFAELTEPEQQYVVDTIADFYS